MVSRPMFGRTHRTLPSRWLRLLVPDPSTGDTAFGLLEAALDSGLPLDLSVQPALWGGGLRGRTLNPAIMTMGGDEISRARDATQAADFVQAHLLQTLSSLGREAIDFYFLRVRCPLEEAQIAGALECLENARQEGHVQHLGLFADAPALAVLGMWQFHDAFDALLVRPGERYAALSPLARQRRVGIVTLGDGPGDATLTPVASVAAVSAQVPEHA